MPVEGTAFLGFIAASLALLVVPGPAVLYIVTRSISQGRLAGLVSVLGISLGVVVHVLAAALGLSALLMSSALAFTIVKYLGAGYLIYLGIRTLMKPAPAGDAQAPTPRSLPRIFRQGVIVQILNPKAALFFFAFLPQFVDPTRGPVAVQIVFLGIVFILMAICTDGTYAMVAGTIGGWLRTSRTYRHIQRYFAGGVYILLGVSTAFASGERSE